MGVTMVLDLQGDARPWQRRDRRNGMEKNAPAGQKTYSVTVTAGLQAAGDTMRQGTFELDGAFAWGIELQRDEETLALALRKRNKSEKTYSIALQFQCQNVTLMHCKCLCLLLTLKHYFGPYILTCPSSFLNKFLHAWHRPPLYFPPRAANHRRR
jgi:hypothetical protein